MKSFDIDQWINQLPERFTQLLDSLLQPVPLTIFAILLFYTWQKLKLGTKFASLFHKFFKLMRTLVVVGVIILVASFFQYMNSDVSSKQLPQTDDEKQLPTVREEKRILQHPDMKKPRITQKPQKITHNISLFNHYIFLLPDELALQNARIEKNYNEGLISLEKENYNAAITYFSTVIKQATKYAFPYCARGIAFAKQGNFRRALADFDEAIFLDSSSAEVFNNRAIVFMEQQQQQIALRDLNNALFLNKSISQIYVNRGYLQYLLKDYDEAIYDWKKAIYINERHANELDIWLQKAYEKK